MICHLLFPGFFNTSNMELEGKVVQTHYGAHPSPKPLFLFIPFAANLTSKFRFHEHILYQTLC